MRVLVTASGALRLEIETPTKIVGVAGMSDPQTTVMLSGPLENLRPAELAAEKAPKPLSDRMTIESGLLSERSSQQYDDGLWHDGG